MSRLFPRALLGRVAVFVVFSLPVVTNAEPLQPPALPKDSSEGPTRETVITASRYETPATQVGSSVSVLTAERIEAHQLVSVADALREVPGVTTISNGGLGTVTQVLIRGSNPNHTLVLIDGVEASDPSSPDGAFDFADLSTQNVARIEVLRGPASSLYGSQAMGGVINIITKTGVGPAHFDLLAEGGRYQTYRVMGNGRGGNEWGNFSISAGELHTGGLPLGQDANGNAQSNPYGRAQVLAKGALTCWKPLELHGMIRYGEARSHLYDFVTGAAFDPNFTSFNRVLLARIEARGSMLSGKWQHTLGFSNLWERRAVDNLADLQSPNTQMSRYAGSRQMLDWQHRFALAESNQALLLLDAKQDAASAASSYGSFSDILPRTSAQMLGVALQDRQQIGGLNLSASGRFDHHSIFGNALTYTVGMAFELFPGGLILRASEGTGFKGPTLYQLLDPTYGNPALKAERNISIDEGAELPLGRHFRVGSTVFTNHIRSLISFDPTSLRSLNINAARITGVESFAQWNISTLRVRADHTYMEPIDLETGKDLVRRPRHKLGVSVDATPRPGLTLTARGDVTGYRYDNDYAASGVPRRLPPYVLVTFTGQYQVIQGVSVFARVENVLNQAYEEVLTYPVAGRSAFAGLRMEL